MSVTFFMPDAPTEKYQPFDNEPDYWSTRPVEPFVEINMANSNAAAILNVIDPGCDVSGGRWELEKMHAVFKRTMRALNIDATVSSLILADSQDGIFYECGRSQDYVTRRLTDMAKLLSVAIQHKFPINYG